MSLVIEVTKKANGNKLRNDKLITHRTAPLGVERSNHERNTVIPLMVEHR